jgi:hypothetical protein
MDLMIIQGELSLIDQGIESISGILPPPQKAVHVQVGFIGLTGWSWNDLAGLTILFYFRF